jgi:uncharacterized membrane protein YeaQ/YmgE (transglycosylase-associated protein family)
MNFLVWFVIGPIVGWLTGILMRKPGNGWLDAVAGLIGAFLLGTICDLLALDASDTLLTATLFGAAGALAVTFIFRKVLSRKANGAPKGPSAGSYTSYKSRMDK